MHTLHKEECGLAVIAGKAAPNLPARHTNGRVGAFKALFAPALGSSRIFRGYGPVATRTCV